MHLLVHRKLSLSRHCARRLTCCRLDLVENDPKLRPADSGGVIRVDARPGRRSCRALLPSGNGVDAGAPIEVEPVAIPLRALGDEPIAGADHVAAAPPRLVAGFI